MGCTHDCSSCASDCKTGSSNESMKTQLNKQSKVRKVIAVVSGKGGVGKSTVTVMLAASMNREGFSTAILDADITGPSIPKMFGLTEKALGDEDGILPALTEMGIKVMSVNLLLENDTDPVVWRGPVISGTVNQFWSDVVWGDVDYMFIDMPPGTGDVALTVFQSLPIDGIVVVTSPQQLVSMIVEKAINMAELMNIPIIGVIENMSVFRCPECGREYPIFGESHLEDVANRLGIKVLAKLPIDSEFAKLADEGKTELFVCPEIDDAVSKIK